MVFSSISFLFYFLPLLLGLYYIAKPKYRNAVLVVASLLFYSWGEPNHLLLMLACIVANYLYGLWLGKTKHQKFILILCLLTNLGILSYFKYFNFIVENIGLIVDEHIITSRILLPLGLSFFIFKAISYIMDVYRGIQDKKGIRPQKNIIKLGLYIAFFPELMSGPISKYSDIETQLENRKFDTFEFSYGIKRFIFGLAKKILICNSIALMVDSVFGMKITELNTAYAWIGALGYSLQIYYDFSGYSDMAIGISHMFGFKIRENFNYPYLSQSIKDFWRRWHISLSTWFRNYLYFPLGGNRKGRKRTYINLFIVFLATGIWHGANWTFLIWGIIHGIFLVVERLKLGELLDKNK